uniref:RxLR effector candidate protein n=1 Tax=Hyaloperonospora arabidopsidis (strain Emoy2) TaxID=559515 RepID=M4BTE2_HYAAE
MAVQSSLLLLSLLQGTENCEVGALESTMGDPLIKRYRARGTDESRHRRPGYPRP